MRWCRYVGVFAAFLTVSLLVIGIGSWADHVVAGGADQASVESDAAQEGVDQDRARRAVLDGEIMSLRHVLAGVEARYDGRILDVFLKDQEAGLYGWVYDIRLLLPDQRVLLLRIDAGTGHILMVDGDETDAP